MKVVLKTLYLQSVIISKAMLSKQTATWTLWPKHLDYVAHQRFVNVKNCYWST